MSRDVTLSQLRTDIAAQCDFSTSTTGRYTPTLLNRLINQSIQRFRERISNEGMTHFLVPATGTLPQGTTSTYAFQTLDLSSLSPSLVRTYGVDITVAGIVKTLNHRPFTERNDYIESTTMTGEPRAWAHLQTRSIAIMPAPDASYAYTVWYLPVLADLTADGDTFDGVAGWEVWVLWDCVCQLIARDQYATAYTQAIAERDLAWQDIVRSATKVSAAGGAIVGRDSMGQTGLWGRGAVRSVGAGGTTGLPPNSSVTNAMLVTRTGPIVLGRLDTTTGNVEDVPVPSLTSYIGKFSGTRPGLVPSGTGSVADSLRGDGTWGNATTGASGLSPTLLAPIQSPRFLGRLSAGTGSVEILVPTQAATMLPEFTALSKGLVPSPAGVAPAFLSASGWRPGIPGGPTMLAATPAQGVQYNGGSGFAADALFTFNPTTKLLTVNEIGLPPHAFPTGFGDKLAGWTASGFANVATAIALVASGQAMQFGNYPFTGNTSNEGHIRGPNRFHVRASDSTGGTGITVFFVGSDNVLTVGDVTNTELDLYAKNNIDINLFGAVLPIHRFSLGGLSMGSGTNVSWTANGALAVNTGAIEMSVGGGVKAAIASGGIAMKSNDITGVRRINNVDGQKSYGDLSVSSASGIVNVNAGSGSIFHITASVAQSLALQPSAVHGDAILIQNRSAATHTVYNLGTGMGAPSGEIFKINPSGAAWARFASGAWELASRFQLGGF